MQYLINKFESNGVFNVSKTDTNKDKETLLIGNFEGSKKQFTFIKSLKDYILKNPRKSTGFVYKKGVLLFDWYNLKNEYKATRPIK